MIFLGFSVLAEHAHQNQGRPHIFSLLDQRTNANHEHGRGNIQKTNFTSEIPARDKSYILAIAERLSNFSLLLHF